MRTSLLSLLFAAGLATGSPLSAQLTSDAPGVRPDAVIDLATTAGVQLVRGGWRYSDAAIIGVDHRGPGPDLRASGPPARTLDITPHAGRPDYDDSSWTTIAPEALETRRGAGRLSFNWYRTAVTIPDRVGALDPTGATIVFEIVVDDYAEIWVDGKLPIVLGQTGGALVKGFNAPNRVVLTRDARPGQVFQLAVLGMNGPVSEPPPNFIWVRSATLDIFKPGRIGTLGTTRADVRRLDPALDALVPSELTVEKLAAGFIFTEGPVWHPDGYLLFSDPNANTIYRWTPDGQVSVYRTKSGYAGLDIGEYGQPGSNGLALDVEQRLTINQHGNRRVIRLEPTGALTVLADRYDGKRLNSPNDLVYRSDGMLYFTDPPFGLPNGFDDRRKELPFSGVYAVIDGVETVMAKDLAGPNGLAFSPDERFLYVTNWDPKKKVVMRYAVAADGSLSDGRVFFDMTPAPGEDALDGIKVDERGNLYVSGPGGLWIVSPEGAHLGTIVTPEHPHNLAWGGDDGRSLFLTAQTGLYRLTLKVRGARARTHSND